MLSNIQRRYSSVSDLLAGFARAGKDLLFTFSPFTSSTISGLKPVTGETGETQVELVCSLGEVGHEELLKTELHHDRRQQLDLAGEKLQYPERRVTYGLETCR